MPAIVKQEPLYAYDGHYDCLMCSESVRPQISDGLVLKCSECVANSFHRACAGEWTERCPQCEPERNTVKVWTGDSIEKSQQTHAVELETSLAVGKWLLKDFESGLAQGMIMDDPREIPASTDSVALWHVLYMKITTRRI